MPYKNPGDNPGMYKKIYVCMYVCVYVAQLVRVCSWRLATSRTLGQSSSAGGPYT